MSSDDVKSRYPLCTSRLSALLSALHPDDGLQARRVGPVVLRAPPALARTQAHTRAADINATINAAGDDDDDDPGALLGELTDMVLVGASDSNSGVPEVHLQFKSEVFGGLFLRLEKTAQGLKARFIVKDAATRREVAAHVDDLVAHLRTRGFVVAEATLEVG